MLKNPGSYGTDVVVGEAQPLGVPMNFGGPHAGIFAVREMTLARSIPGRLIGMTTTKEGSDKAFCMVLQTREQHIRRENASSNICTNQALLALAAACYLSLLGRNGFARLGEVILGNSHYAAERLGEVKGTESPLFEGPFFKEFAVGYGGAKAEDVYEKLGQRGIMAGYPLTRALPWHRRGRRLLRHRGPLVGRHFKAGDVLCRRSSELARKYRQARWDEPLLSELSRKGRTGFMPPKDPKIEAWKEGKELIPARLRAGDVKLPEIAELQVLRHFNRLSQMNFSVESGTYPLGSCTMKYNPKVSEYIASSPGMREAHPFQPEGTIQGLLGIFYDLSVDALRDNGDEGVLPHTLPLAPRASSLVSS